MDLSVRTMLKLAVAAAVIAGTSSTVLQANADPVSDAKKAIQAQYNASNAAASKKNLKAFTAIYAPDFSQTDPQGKAIQFRTVKQRMALQFSQSATITGSTTVSSVKLQGNKATVHIKDRHVYEHASPQTGNSDKFGIDIEADDVWTLNGVVWTRSASRITSEKDTVNGKPVTIK